MISCAGMGLLYPKFSKDYLTNSIMGLKEEIRKARAKTRGVIGVNVMVALSNFSDMVKTSIAEKADIIFSGAGLPLDLPSYLQRESTTKLVPIVSSARAAKIICEKWKANYDYLPDAIVVEGPKAGGHLGYKNNQIDDANYSLEHIVPEVVAEARHFEKLYGRRIPVIAAGGLYTGEDIYRIMELGADGVQLGSKVRDDRRMRRVAGVQGHLYQFPRGRHRNHRQPGRNAGARDRRGIHPPGARRADPSEKSARSTASRPATTPRVPTALSWRCTMRPKATCPADTLSQEPMRSCPKRSRASAKRSLRYRPSSAQRNCAANAARCRYNARQGRAAACFQNGIRRYFLSLGIVFV